jgi:hypothetical protein
MARDAFENYTVVNRITSKCLDKDVLVQSLLVIGNRVAFSQQLESGGRSGLGGAESGDSRWNQSQPGDCQELGAEHSR